MRAFWDGDCRNGFAYGLGRDIAISDTHHVEEIIVHDGTGNDWNQPRVDYDFVNNRRIYAVGGAQYPAATTYREEMIQSIGGFDVRQRYEVVDGSGNVFILQSSPFSPQRMFMNARTDSPLAFEFMDTSAAPPANPDAPIFMAQILNSKTRVVGGVAVARYANGAVRHARVSDAGMEPVIIPSAHTDHLHAKFAEAYRATENAESVLQPARQIEREYLFKACNGKNGVEGLDDADYRRICSWSDQFKDAYAAASANYQKQLESLKQQAATVQQQQQIDRQIALQQRMLQQEQAQQMWNNINEGNRALQQTAQRATQAGNGWQAPQVQPIAPPGGAKVICETIGLVTTCR